jgi:hypothetical protein
VQVPLIAIGTELLHGEDQRFLSLPRRGGAGRRLSLVPPGRHRGHAGGRNHGRDHQEQSPLHCVPSQVEHGYARGVQAGCGES